MRVLKKWCAVTAHNGDTGSIRGHSLNEKGTGIDRQVRFKSEEVVFRLYLSVRQARADTRTLRQVKPKTLFMEKLLVG
jgi:hypothetical protein